MGGIDGCILLLNVLLVDELMQFLRVHRNSNFVKSHGGDINKLVIVVSVKLFSVTSLYELTASTNSLVLTIESIESLMCVYQSQHTQQLIVLISTTQYCFTHTCKHKNNIFSRWRDGKLCCGNNITRLCVSNSDNVTYYSAL